MNVSSVGSPAQYLTAGTQDSVSASIDATVLDQVKTDGQDAVALIDSAAGPAQAGHSLSVYA